MKAETLAPNALSLAILVAEDHPVQAQLLRHLLEGQGHSVQVAANGRLALAAARANRPSLLVSDVDMPEMDGYALCRAIRADAALSDLPVILVTSLSAVEDIAMALECGADNFVGKPYDAGALLSRIGQLVRREAEPGDELTIGAARFRFNSSRRQMIDLLLSSYDEAVRLNGELQKRQDEVVGLNEALERSARDLQAANHELEAFSYTVSHDLRAPLHAIDGFAHALADHGTGLDDRSRHYLRRIRSNAQRMESMIDGLLALAKATLVPPLKQELDLSALVREVAGEIAEADGDRQVALDIEAGLRAQGDTRLLRQLLANLLGNAWKFTRTSPVARIGFGAQAPADGTAQRVFYVKDNGVGFDMAHATRLFEVFQRLHSGDEYPGTGIGLATVKRIAAHHGGSAWAQSEPGKGTTIFFTLGS